MNKKIFKYIVVIILLGAGLWYVVKSDFSFFKTYKRGQKIDSLNGVYVYYNGKMSNVSGRTTVNGYNVGLKYQCVEFVKRYYLEELNHKMPNSYGHAKNFFQKGLKDGSKNKARNLRQYTNPSQSKPQVKDLIIFDGHLFNKYGHVAIVAKVSENSVEIIQQNTGTNTRETLKLKFNDNKWHIENHRILGWLRK